ncbi:MAG: PAS domain S-box protein [Desulfobacteraceae bacterium]|nr:PAS domain S-box protein [Desulfobacteraceae bacterium]
MTDYTSSYHKQPRISPEDLSSEDYEPPYGELTELNTRRLILDSVGEETLDSIVSDFLDMLGTSVAVYEKNGNYALGILSSAWCRFMDRASYDLCRTENTKEVLACGKWICHESCWNTAKQAMDKGEPADVECEGGICLYAVPIRASGEIIGTINVGYGDPPTDISIINELAAKYGVAEQDLIERAKAYESRPPFIIEMAKRRIHSAAHLIGEIVERKQAEQALRQSENYYRTIFENSASALFIIEEDTVISQVNSKFEKLMGFSRDEVEGKKSWTDFIHPDDVGWMKEYHYLRRRDAAAAPSSYEFRFISRDGRVRSGFLTVAMIPGTPKSIAFLIDVTEQKQAEEERENMREQLLQSQKMESVGRLAGGVAHEFNNMLSIINGYAEMMTDVLSPSEPIFDNARKIQDAGKRSAVIIRKLLAFARKQTISPEAMNLNDSLSGMIKMLERLIGEDIDLVWKPDKDLWQVKMDFSQIDQILVNLVVNARDAISGAGEIIIETENAEFDKEYCEIHTGFLPGQFVMLAVSDSGCGMSKEVQEHVFEPFFTTKEVGKGSGLGLPTVYGIVKQNSGFVNVYSEPGIGTTIKIYLPRYKGDDTVPDKEAREAYPAKGDGETILVLEDEAEVLDITRMMLEKLGYNVLTADTPGRAMERAEAHEGKIDLLITDVVMPEMNGRDFADKLRTLYPGLKTLFMSGYTANVVARHNVAEQDLNFIGKPFAIKDIADKVAEVLSES